MKHHLLSAAIAVLAGVPGACDKPPAGPADVDLPAVAVTRHYHVGSGCGQDVLVLQFDPRLSVGLAQFLTRTRLVQGYPPTGHSITFCPQEQPDGADLQLRVGVDPRKVQGHLPVLVRVRKTCPKNCLLR